MLGELHQSKKFLSLSTGLALVLVATPALAQEASPGPAATKEDDTSNVIVVTAQKRAQFLQDVPVAVSAVTSDQLISTGATKLSDYAAAIPGLQVDSQSGQPGSTNVTLRGITTADINSTTTAIMIDDVPVGATSSHTYSALNGVDLTPYDLDHIEVLKGPQGTLYGASSLGGLVKYVTPTPRLGELSVRAAVEGAIVDHDGSQFGHSERAMANLPIGNNVALNISAGRVYVPGYIDNVATGEKAYNDGYQQSARASLRADLTPDLDVRLTYLYNHSDFNGLGTVVYDVGVDRPVYGNLATSYVLPTGDRRTQHIGIARVTYDFGWASLTSLTGFNRATGRSSYDITALLSSLGINALGPGQTNFNTKRWSEELRLTSAGDKPFRYILGLFYSDERNTFKEIDDALDPATGGPAAGLSPLVDVRLLSTVKEKAVFANLEYDITSAWMIGGGVRYSHNDQTFAYLTRPGVLDPPSTVFDPTSDNSTTFSVTSSYHFAKDTMLYGRIATGYRPGGATQRFPGVDVPPVYRPDTVTSYEVGFKSANLFDRLSLSIAAFYIDWKDIQLTQRTPAGLAYVGNAGSAKSQGIELESSLRLARGFRISASGAYTDAKITSDAPAVGAVDGDRLPYSPRFTGLLAADWSHKYSENFAANFRAAYRHVGKRLSNFPGALAGSATLAAYDVVDLSGSIDLNNWTIGAYMRNATDKRAFLSAQNFGAAVLQPRTVGISLEFRFH